MLNKTRHFIYMLLTTILLVCSVFIYSINESSKYISIFSCFISILFIIKFRYDIPILILFLFIFSYSFETLDYYFRGILLTVWLDFQKPEYVNKVLILDSLFVFSLGNMLQPGISRNPFSFNNFNGKSHWMFWLNFFICSYIIYFGIVGDSIIDGGLYSSVEKSSLNEYFIIPFLFLNLTKPSESRSFSILIFILFTFYSLNNIVYGGRIEVLQVTLLLFLYYKAIPGKINIKWVYVFMLIGIYSLTVIGNVRSNPAEFLNGNYISFLNPVEVLLSRPEDRIYAASNQGDVIQSSARILGLIETGYLTYEDRLLSAASYISSPFLPTSKFSVYSNLAAFGQGTFQSGGGGLIAVYFYTWLSFTGPILVGLFIGFFVNKLYSSNSGYFKIYGLLLLSTFPRWYAYNPIFLVKLCLYAVLAFFLYRYVFNIYREQNDIS